MLQKPYTLEALRQLLAQAAPPGSAQRSSA
jgi:hypothetical protein